jgi:Tfp pilus assembly protein PilF
MNRSLLRFGVVLGLGMWSSSGALAQGAPAITPANSLTPVPDSDAKAAADAAYRDGRFDEAERLLNGVLAKNAQDDVALYLRASTRVERGAEEGDAALVRSGIADARAALGIKINPDYYLPYLYGMSRLAEIEKRPEHARGGIAVADKVLAMADVPPPKKANIYYQRGLLNIAIGDNQTGEADLRNAIKADPKHLAAHSALCDLKVRTATPQDAEAQYDQTLAQLKDQPLLYNNRGTFLQQMGRHDEALHDFEKAAELDPTYVPAWTNRGFARLMLGQFAQAEADLTKSIELDPQQPVAFGLRGTARLQQGRSGPAVEDYQTAVSLDPDNPATYYDLGFAHFFARKYAEARDAFNQAVKADPSIQFLDPWRYTATVFSGQRDEAVSEFGAVEQKPVAQRTWFDVMTLYLMGRINEDEVLASVSKDPPHVKTAQECEAYYFFGLRTASRNQPDQAKQYFEKAVATNARHLSAYRGALFALGKFQ